MNRGIVVNSVAALALGICCCAAPTCAQTAKDVVGTWTMVANVTEQDGKKTEPFGTNPKGIMVLDGSGHYVVVSMRATLPKFASNNRVAGTPEENAGVVQGSITHFGTYSVNEADKTLLFKIENSTFANWNGAEQKRPFTLTGDELTYTIPTSSVGGTARVVWKRVK